MRNLLARLFGGTSPTARSLRVAAEAAEIARLQGIANEPPPPGDGWRVGNQDSEGKWTVWRGPTKIAAFWDENEASEWARAQNRDPGRPNPVMREDGKYCVNCRNRDTDESLKARGYVSCCPERYVLPEAWHVTDTRLVTGNWHLWRPADGLPSIDADHSWPDHADAAHEADHRNLLEFRNVVVKPAALAGSPDAADALAYGLTAAKIAARDNGYDPVDESGHSAGFAVEQRPIPMGGQHAVHTTGFAEVAGMRPAKATGEWATVWDKAAAEARPDLAAFLDVPIPDGVRLVVGPHKHPTLGNWWTFDRSGPVQGYMRKENAQKAAIRANHAPQT